MTYHREVNGDALHDRAGDAFVEWSVAAGEMDRLWAAGWRHFGPIFYRYETMKDGDAVRHIQPLRIVLDQFRPSKSQRRVLRRNADLAWSLRPTTIGDELHRLFAVHKQRFKENIPTCLEELLGAEPAFEPCDNVTLLVRAGERLVAASFLDIGDEAVSSVYGMFCPSESRRSLGICTMMWEILYAREKGFRHYYPGYACHEPSLYDYKKQFSGLEWFDWQGTWRPLIKSQTNTQ